MTDTVSKAPGQIAGMFDAIAGRYDFLNHLLSAGIDRRWRARAVQALGLAGAERVLDLCTGTADLAIASATARRPAPRVVAIDFAGAMLDIAHTKIRRKRLHDRIALVRGDAVRLPLADRTVDAITIGFGIRNVEDVDGACHEMRRVLKAGGRLAILEFAVPTTVVWSSVYLWYLRRVLPKIGRVVSRHRGAYSYLPASIDRFATPDEFVTILRRAGFVDVSAVPLTFGSVCLYTARG